MGMDVLISRKRIRQSACPAFPYGEWIVLVAQAFLPVLILERILHGLRSPFPRRTNPRKPSQAPDSRGTQIFGHVLRLLRSHVLQPQRQGEVVRLFTMFVAACCTSQIALSQKPL